jgi:hypothetical protein
MQYVHFRQTYWCKNQRADRYLQDNTARPLVEREALVRAFSLGSTLEPKLKAFRRRGSKGSLETPPFSPGWYNQPWQKGCLPMAFSRNDWRGILALGGITNRD